MRGFRVSSALPGGCVRRREAGRRARGTVSASSAWLVRVDARFLGRVRPAGRARPGEVGLRNRLHPQQGSAVLHVPRRERPGRSGQPRDRGPQGAVRGVRIHVSEREHAGALRVPLRPRRGPGETPRRHRRVAGDLDARRQPGASRVAGVRRD